MALAQVSVMIRDVRYADLFKTLIQHPVLLISFVGLLVGVLVARSLGVKQSHKSGERVERLRPELPQVPLEGGYVSSNRCQACHESEHESWQRTFHRTMTQAALPGNVAGAFDGTTVSSDGLEYRVFEEEDQYWVEMPDPDEMMYVVQGGKKLAVEDIPRVRLPVVMSTGSHHYQTYWVPSPRHDQLLQTLPLVYLIKDKQWIPREAAFMRGPNDRGHFVTQWNHHCIRCHSTGGNPGLNSETGMLETKVGELGIACEACHGPGEEHVAFYQDPVNRYRSHFEETVAPTIVNPAKLDHRASSQVCGQCHGVFITREEYAMEYAYKGVQYRPGEDLDKTRYYVQHPRNDATENRRVELEKNPEFFRERWWNDGSILAGGREYTAMSVSSCYTKGEISCLSCHSMHDSDPVDQLNLDMDTSQACTQCHKEENYNSQVSLHTFHEVESSGSNCLNCHMPRTTYALFGAIRSHQIGSPNPVSTLRFGVPNACNLCHLDKTLAWTQEHMGKRYGTQMFRLTDDQKEVSAALLWLLKGNAAQRAITAWHIGWKPAQEISGTDWMAPFQARLLSDPYGVVRYVAAKALRTLPGFSEIKYDFLAPEHELEQTASDAVKLWQNQPMNLSRSGTEVLIQSGGQVMETKVEQLLLQRDNRPVTIKE